MAHKLVTDENPYNPWHGIPEIREARVKLAEVSNEEIANRLDELFGEE